MAHLCRDVMRHNLESRVGRFLEAKAMYHKCIEYDDPVTGLSKLAHEKLGSTNRLIGNMKHNLRSTTRSAASIQATQPISGDISRSDSVVEKTCSFVPDPVVAGAI